MTTVDPKVAASAVTTRFVCKEKGGDVRARCVAQDYWREIGDQDSIYASTPLLVTVKLLLLIALQCGFSILLGDTSTAFLHAAVLTDYFVWPPKEYYPDGNVLWKLRKALHGMKGSPRAWQDYFADVLRDLCGRRFKSDANLYYFASHYCYMLVYVDDIMIVGKHTTDLFKGVDEKVLLRRTWGTTRRM